MQKNQGYPRQEIKNMLKFQQYITTTTAIYHYILSQISSTNWGVVWSSTITNFPKIYPLLTNHFASGKITIVRFLKSGFSFTIKNYFAFFHMFTSVLHTSHHCRWALPHLHGLCLMTWCLVNSCQMTNDCLQMTSPCFWKTRIYEWFPTQ